MLVTLQGIAANEFGESVGLVRRGTEYRTHFMEKNRDAAFGKLIGRFRTGETAA